MGLDMYLEGRKHYFEDWKNPENDSKEDGFRIKEKVLELGYWRKHPDLHGYIVTHFADGKDECQEIDLTRENLEELINAVTNRQLPETTGFFFGRSTHDSIDSPEEIQKEIDQDLKILNNALQWLGDEIVRTSGYRCVVYRASW